TSIYDPDHNNFAPRIGFAYSPKLFDSRHVTVIRGGAGVFYDQILGAVVSQSRNVFPTFVTLNFGGLNASAGESLLTFFNPGRTIVNNGAGQFVTIASPGTLNQLNPALPLSQLINLINRSFPSGLGATIPTRHLEMPQAVHYDLVFEQQLGTKTILSVAYVGTQGRRLLRFTTPNLGPASTIVPSSFTTFQQQFTFPEVTGRVLPPARPVAGLGAIYQFETTANSGYHALQVELRGRYFNSFQYRAAYTFSKATDDVSDVFDLAGAFSLPQNSETLSGE